MAKSRDEHMNRSISECCVVDDLCFAPDFSGFLHCLDAKTGQVYWTFDMQSAMWGSPMAADGKIYVTDEDGDVRIFAISKEMKKLSPDDDHLNLDSRVVLFAGVFGRRAVSHRPREIVCHQDRRGEFQVSDSAGIQSAARKAADQLDEHVRQIVQWHFDPRTGCPFWLEKAASLGWDPAQRNSWLCRSAQIRAFSGRLAPWRGR